VIPLSVSLTPFAVIYFTRAYWLPRLPPLHRPSWAYLPPWLEDRLGTYVQLPTTFQGDIEAGLHSQAFDLSGNMTEGDERTGLDDKSKKAILRIMQRRRVNFDEARRLYTEEEFRKMGISADGTPMDAKFVSFS